MEPRGLADPLDAERTRLATRTRLFGGPAQPLRAGRFEVLERIGRGGMAAVYAARDPDLARDVAIKVLHGGGAPDGLVAEAKALARLRHPNVVSVYEVGAIAGHTFVAMERVDGPSLRAWLSGRERSWREILSVLTGAARGLAAAHAAGLVHRDFKPDNVVIDAADQARVVDFGLARDAEDDVDEPVSTASERASASVSSRVVSRLAGTLAYMAPELLAGHRASPASDQYAFCVTLFEALSGSLPFRGKTTSDLTRAITSGAPPELAAPDVPRHVRAAVRKGLSRRPEDRHASLDVLLGELLRDPARTRRLAAWGVVAGAGVVGAIALAARWGGRGPDCQSVGAAVAEVWSPAARASIRSAFEAAKLPTSTGGARTTERGLERYAGELAAMSRDACEATHVRGEQSASALDARGRCLSRRREALRAAVSQLASGDGGVLSRAVTLVERLPPIAACADVEALMSTVQPPDDPEKRARLTELERRLEVARAAYSVARLADAADAIGPVVDEARALDHKPFLGEVLFVSGALAWETGDVAGAEAALVEAVRAGQSSGHVRVVAEAATVLVGVTGDEWSKPDKARVWADVAEASVQRVNDPQLAAVLHDRIGVALHEEGKIEESLRRMERAVLAMESLGDTKSATYAGILSDHATVLDSAGRYPEARALLRRALEISESVLGPLHTEVAKTLNELAITLEHEGKNDEALAAYERAVEIAEASGEKGRLDDFVDNLGDLLVTMGRAEEGLAKRLRAHDIRLATLPEGHGKLAVSWGTLGDTYLSMSRFDDAIAAYSQCVSLERRRSGHDRLLVASCLADMAYAHEEKEELEKALALYTEAGTLGEALSGPGIDARRGGWLAGQGRTALALRRTADARGPLERAVPLLATGDDKIAIASARFDLARTLHLLGVDRARSRELAQQARRELEGTRETAGAAEIEAWLARTGGR